MDYMFRAGFLGTRAPFFMDYVTLIVALLPLLVAVAILMAKRRAYTLHSLLQISIFLISVVVLGYFEYGVRAAGGFKSFMQDSSVSYNYALWVLIFHITVSTITLILWAKLLFVSYKERNNTTLPGQNSKKHKRYGKRVYVAITLTSLTGIWVYLLMFVY